jgi:fibronectin-binding autotransporter adhesin
VPAIYLRSIRQGFASLAVGSFFLLAVAPVAKAQSTWSGVSSNVWTNGGNWSAGVPGGGATAVFDAASPNTSITLSGVAQPIGSISFNTGAAAYTLGGLGSGDAFTVDPGGTISVATGLTALQTINANLNSTGALTISNGGAAAGGLTIGGNIAVGGALIFANTVANTTLTLGGDITGASAVAFNATTGGASNNNNIILNGSNTYTGPTTIAVNTGSAGNIQIGTDSPFGTGKVTNNIVTGTASPQFQALGGTRTLANAFDLNGGLTFTGANAFVFTGPMTIINSAANGTRTLNNQIVTAGTSVSLGSAASPSTMTLGNPVANGGDGVGKGLLFTPAANATIVVNDAMLDPAPGGGSASGSVQYAGAALGVIQINGLSTYTGPTLLNGSSTVQFSRDYNASDPSGPFGLGTLTPNNTNNNVLQPIGGNRTIANPMSLVFGFTVSNFAGDSSGVTFTGPIALTTAGRTIADNFTGGTLTFGAAAAPTTFTLSTSPTGVLIVNGAGTTVINDTIQDAPGVPNSVTISGTGTVQLNAQNTYSGGTTLSGAGTIIPFAVSSNGPFGAFTGGPFGTGQINVDNGVNQHLRPIGSQTISNSILLTFGVAMDNAPGDTTSTLTLAGPISLATTSRLISNGFAGGQPGAALIIGAAAAPSTITLSGTAGVTLSFAAVQGPIVVNDTIMNSGATPGAVGINPNNGDNFSVTFLATNTYTGGTTIGGGAFGGGTVMLGVSTSGPAGSFTTGPFGTGPVVMNNTAATSGTPPTLVPLGADRTVANAITMTSGFFVANAPGTSFNLSLTGPISLGTIGRALTNNMASGATLTLGSAASPSTITLGSTTGAQLQFQSQTGTGMTVINNLIQDASGGGAGTILVSSGTVQLTNANTYSGATKVMGGRLLVNNTTGSGTGTGPVSLAGTGAVGSGGTLGGIGTIFGTVTVSSGTGTTQGGIISPGTGSTIGTLNVGSMIWNRLGQYNFLYDATTSATPGTTNNYIFGSGTLNLGDLSNAPFNFNLLPTNFSPAPTVQNYTVATFAGGIIGPQGAFTTTPADVSALFTLSGGFTSNTTAFASVVAGPGGGSSQSLVISFTPVPEPAFVLAACGGVTALVGWRRARRRI